MMFRCTECLSSRSIVPTPVKHDHFLSRGQVGCVALKVPGIPFLIRRRSERHNARLARAQMLDDPLDCSVLAACVPPLEYDEDLVTMFDDVPLNLDQLNLQLTQ